MTRITALILMLAFYLGASAYAGTERGGERGGGSNDSSAPVRQRAFHANRSAPARQPMVIHMNHANGTTHVNATRQPSYGSIQWNHSTQTHTKAPAQRIQATKRLNTPRAAGIRAANVVHHQAYAQGVVRQRLAKIGVKSEPSHITDRSEIVSTDRAHSIIGYPRTGPKGEAIKGSLVSARAFNNSGVRAQMTLVNRPEFSQQLERERAGENERGRTYWHTGAGFNYAHYVDNSGYHWYGWYNNNQYFWTRNYEGRWWWYDTGFNRWCFYNNNYWWWQDPYHVGDLYVYDNSGYVPANSADDQIVVTGSEQANDIAYNSPDGTRTVKIAKDDGDAFLYDTANPPSFDPIYLASGVESVQYSGENNGRPTEIVLRLNDGSYDMFDAQGNPYNSQTSEMN